MKKEKKERDAPEERRHGANPWRGEGKIARIKNKQEKNEQE